MFEKMSALLCLCGSPLNSNDFEYYCKNCPQIRFPRYVVGERMEIDLIQALNVASKRTIKVADESLEEMKTKKMTTDERMAEEIHVSYLALSYTFTKSGKNWVLVDVRSTTRVWKDKDPQTVSDQIQALQQKSGADFYFYRE